VGERITTTGCRNEGVVRLMHAKNRGFSIWAFGLAWILCAAFPLQASAGAWPTEAGAGQIISTSLFDNASQAFDENGDASQAVSFSKFEGAVYMEHGLTAKTTLVLQSSFQDIQFRAGVDDVNFSGLGESYLGLRHLLWDDDKTVISAQGGVLFAGAGEAIADADLGFGTTHYEARVLLGRSFKLAKRDGFIDLQAARRFRPGNFPDEWRLDATTGWRPVKNIQILAQGFYTASEAEFEIARRNTRLKLQGSLVYDRSAKTSYQIGLYQTVAGQNIVKEKAFFIAIWSRY